MADFIDKLPNFKLVKLLEEMKAKPTENVVASTEISAYGGKLHVVHGKDHKGNLVESIYTDYYIEKIYGSTPSDYDQLRFQNTMKELLKGTPYASRCNAFNRKKGKKLEYREADFGDDDEDENE